MTATRVFGWLACVVAVGLLVAAMIGGTTAAAGTGATGTGARVSDVTIRPAIVPGRPAAGYFTLTSGTTAVELTSVTSSSARVELHAMSMAGGVMRMDTLPSVRLLAGQSLRFAPGGSHLMLFGLPATFRPGATLPLSFVFADRSVIHVAAIVVALPRPITSNLPARLPATNDPR